MKHIVALCYFLCPVVAVASTLCKLDSADSTKYLSHGQIRYIFGQPHEIGAIYQVCFNGLITCFEEDAVADGNVDTIVNCHKYSAKRRLGLATPKKQHVWPYATMCYVIQDAFTPTEHKLILKAIHTIISLTGISIVDLHKCTGQICGNCKHYVSIDQFHDKRGTFSEVGYREYAGQKVNLLKSIFYTGQGAIIHQLLHSLGVIHEHVHPASEAVVIRENRLYTSRSNYIPVQEAMVTQYDMHSIMHYLNGICLPKKRNIKYCTIDQNELDGCIIPTSSDCDPKATALLGQRKTMTKIDIRNLQLLYDLPLTVSRNEVDILTRHYHLRIAHFHKNKHDKSNEVPSI
ncbi:metalloprotease family M12A [Thraustotheca clavata]|uniref:Metalloendopeptidase n=1 Tax=Thraustotheca clavata TaxID=74557 RepID=A0A0A7CLR5_9STRA|nr:secreted protein [Thraustotheca clavata]OQS05046.1 metalloprotease family M12A [Thraustotheca clavata]